MPHTYRAGAIGRTGKGNFGHGLHTCYAHVLNVDMVAVSDEDEEGCAKAASDTGAERSYADYREMLEKENLDIVSVCPRWVDCHEDMILAALDAGCHVYSEKPLASSPASADRIIDSAESKGLKIAVAHQGPYLPQVREALQMISEGRIGSVITVRLTGKMDHRGGGEDLIVLGTHLFNLAQIIVGPPVSVMGRVTVEGRHITPSDAREAGEPVGLIAGDAVFASYEFSNGVTGTFESRKRDNRDGRTYGTEVIGDQGAIAFDASAGHVSILEDTALTPWDAGQVRQSLGMPKAPLMEGNVLAIQDLISSIEEGREPVSSARGARTALEMILGIYASEVSGARVSLPLEDRRHPLEEWKNSA